MDPTGLEPPTTRLEASRVRPLTLDGLTNLDNNIINPFIAISQPSKPSFMVSYN